MDLQSSTCKNHTWMPETEKSFPLRWCQSRNRIFAIYKLMRCLLAENRKLTWESSSFKQEPGLGGLGHVVTEAGNSSWELQQPWEHLGTFLRNLTWEPLICLKLRLLVKTQSSPCSEEANVGRVHCFPPQIHAVHCFVFPSLWFLVFGCDLI